MLQYHDKEWGVPVRDDATLFEYMVLDSFQAGLSWRTILHKRVAFAAAFDDFAAVKIATYDEARVEGLMQNAGIVRNRQKIVATIRNAQLVAEVQAEFGSLAGFLWQFVDGQPVTNAWATAAEVPVDTVASRAMSAALRARGFKFVGTTICYAFMQAAGMVNDHVTDCFRWEELSEGK